MQTNHSNHTDYVIYDGKDPIPFVNQIINILHNPPDLVHHIFYRIARSSRLLPFY